MSESHLESSKSDFEASRSDFESSKSDFEASKGNFEVFEIVNEVLGRRKGKWLSEAVVREKLAQQEFDQLLAA